MRISLRGCFRTLVGIMAGLALMQQSRAQDDTNAALIPGTDSVTWAQNMHQVMGGNSNMLPGTGTIRGPAGVYANVLLSSVLNKFCPSARPGHFCFVKDVDDKITNYFLYLLSNPAVSGLLLQAQWQDLQPSDPGPNPSAPTNPDSTFFNYIDDAFNAISLWNEANPAAPPKTLQLDVTPGFNSPAWLFNYLQSCDGLFMTPAPPAGALSGCGYTTIFYRTENQPVMQLPLPLPWSPAYKAYWRAFLMALSQHIGSNPNYVSSFVSIGVAGPTASSTEIILPNGTSNTANTNKNAGSLTLLPAYVTKDHKALGVSVYQAWNCLLANNYGTIITSGITGNCLSKDYSPTSDYVNSDRAFIEEWAAAIDMYGQIFGGVTLEVTTGNGLANFCGLGTGPSGSPSCPSSYPFLNPPPAFAPDCGARVTMDCAAETAILAYFSGPPVGGANAKSTASAGLTARSDNNSENNPSANRVKWLSLNTSEALSVLNPTSGNWAVVSHMLGGLQFAKSFSDENTPPDNPSGPSPTQYEGCPAAPLPDSPWCTISPEKALRNVLNVYFAGTLEVNAFGGPVGGGTAMNGSQIVVNAPINYLQIWDTDILYAAGWRNCTWSQLTTAPATPGGPPPNCTVENMKTHTVNVPHVGNLTAQDMLNDASSDIMEFTKVTVTYSPVCGCIAEYVPRMAFQGDTVCVLPSQQTQAATDNANALATGSTSTYSTPYTDPKLVPPVPYGICKVDLQYRRAYMGDYVCVTSGTATQVQADNLSFLSRVRFCPVVQAH